MENDWQSIQSMTHLVQTDQSFPTYFYDQVCMSTAARSTIKLIPRSSSQAPALPAFSPTLLAATSAFIAIQALSTRPSMRFISLLQSFITSSALLFCLKLTIPAGRSMRAQTIPETTSLERSSSVSEVGRDSREVSPGIVMRE